MVLVEYGPFVEHKLSDTEYNNFVSTFEKWRKILKLKRSPIIINHVRGNLYKLRAQGVAGFVKIGDLSIQIVPKFINNDVLGAKWQSILWKYLLYGKGVENITVTTGLIGINDGLSDLIADIFIKSLKSASILGYPLGYSEIYQESSFVSGKLDHTKFHKLLPVTGKIHVKSTKLSKDIPVNQLLKWAAHFLLRNVSSIELRSKLRSWLDHLPSVSNIPPKLERINYYEHQYPHISQAVEIAKFLYCDFHILYGDGKLDIPGFLWDSDDLFERVTRRMFKEASMSCGLSTSKNRYKLAKSPLNSNIGMYTIPDIDIHNKIKSFFIADSKYKTFKNHPSSDDFYQILAVGRVCHVSTVALVYPSEGYGINTKTLEPIGDSYPEKVLIISIGLESFTNKRGILDSIAQLESIISTNILIE